MEITEEVLSAILDAYAYEIVFADRDHIVCYMNATAKRRYAGRVSIGASLFNCHNENSRIKNEQYLKRADDGENEMYENRTEYHISHSLNPDRKMPLAFSQ